MARVRNPRSRSSSGEQSWPPSTTVVKISKIQVFCRTGTFLRVMQTLFVKSTPFSVLTFSRALFISYHKLSTKEPKPSRLQNPPRIFTTVHLCLGLRSSLHDVVHALLSQGAEAPGLVRELGGLQQTSDRVSFGTTKKLGDARKNGLKYSTACSHNSPSPRSHQIRLQSTK